MNKSPNLRAVWWIVLLALCLRVVVRLYQGSADFWVNGYTFFFDWAKSIAAGHGLTLDGWPTAFHVPLYPLLLAAITFGHEAFLPVVLVQAMIGAGTVWCAAVLAREMFGDTAAVPAAAITAIYPYYVLHDTALQETSLFTLLTIAATLLLMRARRSGSGRQAIRAGIVLGMAVLARANLAAFAMMAPWWLAFPGPGATSLKRRLRLALFCAATTLLVVSPWLVRSYLLTGSPVLTTQSGFFLWVGNNPYTFTHYPVESIDRSQAEALTALTAEERAEIKALGSNDAAVDQWFWRKGLIYIGEHPLQTLSNGFRKLEAAFGWWPSPRRGFWPDLVYAVSYGPVMILGMWGMWLARRDWRDHMIIYLLFLSFAVVTAIFFGHTSYRSYLDVYWIVFVAGALISRFVASSPWTKLCINHVDRRRGAQ